MATEVPEIDQPSSPPPPLAPPHMVKAFSRDLALFSNHPDRNRALIFPAVNSFSRLCLHSFVKNSYPELVTFSVGLEKERRPVVCHQMTVAERTLEMIKVGPDNRTYSAPHVRPPTRDNDGSNRDETKSTDNVNEEQKPNTSKRNHKRPDRAVYVPPGSNKEVRKAADPNKNEDESNQINSSSSSKIVNKNASIAPIDPAYLMEIYAVLGFVKLVSPHHDYLALELGLFTKDDLNDNDLPNVVEMYDFPQDFKTDDLECCLHNNLKLIHYYELRWVDDTHALAIFTDVVTANKALNINDPCIKFRPFWCASSQSVTKARILKLTTESTTTRCRPKTSAVTAKRLLARALGMPSINAPKPSDHIQRGGPRSK